MQTTLPQGLAAGQSAPANLKLMKTSLPNHQRPGMYVARLSDHSARALLQVVVDGVNSHPDRLNKPSNAYCTLFDANARVKLLHAC